MSEVRVRSGGIGLCGALFLLFVGLRLTDHIDWAWYWVAAPLWWPLGMIAVAAMGLGLVYAVTWPFAAFARSRRQKRAKARKAMAV